MQGDFLIKDWLVQPQINTVEKGGKRWHLEPKVMQVLVHLALHPDEVLSKERLIEAIWRDTFVGDDVLVRCISEIRYVFGDDARAPSVIQTIPKTGYRLIASVTMEIATAAELRVSADSSARTNGLNNPEKRSRPEDTATAVVLDELSPAQPAIEIVSADERPASEPRAELFAPDSRAIDLPPPAKAGSRSNHRLPWTIALIACLALLAIAAGYGWRLLRPDPFQVFWSPILGTQEPALFCIADQNQYSFITLRDAAEPSRQVVLKDNLSAVVIDDLDTIVRVAGALRARGKQYRLKGEERTSLSDLRNGPSVFIGAFDNAWTLRLSHSLRYHFANNSDMTQFRIVDSSNPQNSGWVVDRTQQMATNNYQDFAIIARFTDPNTGKPAVIIAGIGRGGTVAAGEFLTDPDDLSQLLRAVQAAGNKKNLEIVLSTQIIDGQPGTPKVEASYFW
ncbi:MAG TPA: winged helix-turn-helix domain-containing protein [Edaphobacter sp.]|nr:winged helix-turn-helix domain-containing protein [Edaphobacter sp.]